MGHMTHTSATHDVLCLPFRDAYPVPRIGPNTRPYAMRGCSRFKPPHRVQPQPHTLYPQAPQPTLLGARESDETTLPLLNRAIL